MLTNDFDIFKVYHVHYLNLEKQINHLSLIKQINSKLNVLVNFPIEQKRFDDVLNMLSNNTKIPYHLVFIVEDEHEVSLVEDIVSGTMIDDYSLLPYYNGKNLSFFEEAVFLTKEDVLEAKPSLKEIFTRMAINKSDFGKLAVLSNGNIHANLNAPRIGKLGVNSIHEIVLKELVDGKSWRRLRTKVEPCKQCTFDVLCPHLSNYEYAIGRNNLCHVWDGNQIAKSET